MSEITFIEIWDKLKNPPKEALKEITGGRLKGKSNINPQWRLQIMTEIFGVIGIGWKYDIVKLWIEEASNDQKVAFAEIKLYIKQDNEWSEGISGVGGSMFVEQENKGLYTNDECYKMATTDALSVAMKQLGVAADIYMGIWDGDKYNGQPNNTSSSEPQSDEPWEITRTKLKVGGKSKSAELTWDKVDAGYIKWCLDEKNAQYTTRLKPLAQKEMDWRAGQQETKDFAGIGNKEDTEPEPTDLDELREEVLLLADNILLKKYKIKKTATNITREINNAKTEDTLVTLSLRIKAIDTLCSTYKSQKIDADNYKLILAKLLIAENGEIENIVKDLHKKDPEGDENRSLIEHYAKTIDRQHETLGWSPSQALASMNKHLGIEDHYAIKTWEPLKKYSEHLENKLNNPEPEKEKEEITSLEPEVIHESSGKHKDNGVIFPVKKDSIANPQHEDNIKKELAVQEDIDIG